MIKTLIAHTSEIDDIGAAVREVTAQLDLENSLCANSLGIFACHYDFVYSGAVKAISQALPFDVVGTVSVAQAVNGKTGDSILTLMVLTSDDAFFVTQLTPSLRFDAAQAIREAYSEASSRKIGAPSLILSFAPFVAGNSGDEYVDAFTLISEGIPCFGTMATDDSDDLEHSLLLCNGEHYDDRMGVVLLYADHCPRFFTATLSPEKILDKKAALVTKSDGHIVLELNGRPVEEYFENLGLGSVSQTQYAMTSLPFILDYGDGTPSVSKVFLGRTSEKYAVCAGIMPEGSTMSIGVFDKEDVLFTTGQAVDRALADTGGLSCMLIYSCVSRSMSLEGDVMAELELVKDRVGNKIPFMMTYSGGEMCPSRISSSKAINRFHNNTFIVCLL